VRNDYRIKGEPRRRSVIALPRGRKWITLIDWTTLETARMDLAAWDGLNAEPDGRMNRRKVRAAMRDRLRYVQRTEAVKAAMALLASQAK
jgi:hypothetical protein